MPDSGFSLTSALRDPLWGSTRFLVAEEDLPKLHIVVTGVAAKYRHNYLLNPNDRKSLRVKPFVFA
jgi:hypothetical protein